MNPSPHQVPPEQRGSGAPRAVSKDEDSVNGGIWGHLPHIILAHTLEEWLPVYFELTFWVI